MAFYKGDIFGVVESPTADKGQMYDFITAAEATLPRGAEASWVK
jgi:hypothetical protein